jgi:V8-like Glu-specific endopeptidase
MTTSISNVASNEHAGAIGSVSNVTAAAEAAAAPQLLDKLDGASGPKDDRSSISARDLLVRGKEPFRRKPRRGVPSVFETILGDDERVRVLDTELNPWRMICSLEIQSKFGQWVGTGWLAGPRTVITAGHCVHDPQMGGWAERIVVRAGRSAERQPFGAITCKRFSTTDRWFHGAAPDFDYAAIHLGDEGPALTDRTGWFATVVHNDAALLAQRVNVSGYPGDKGGDTQWFHAKQIVYATEHRIFYDVDTMAGQSGAPVWLDTDDGPRVVGVHAYGVGGTVVNIEANSAPRITAAVLDRIREWLAT